MPCQNRWLGSISAGGADPGGGRPAAWPAARRVPAWAVTRGAGARPVRDCPAPHAGWGYGQEMTPGRRPAGWPARSSAWTAHPPPPPPPPPLLQVVVNV